jgi:predicted enzyme related to lactoylglutathione lyase
MTSGLGTIIYPVKDLAKAKTLYGTLLGVEPYADESYYVGYRVGDQEIGLDPNGHAQGMTGPLAYRDVDDIEKSLQALLDAGAETVQPVHDVGGGKLIATVKDADGNVTGLAYSPW